MQRRRVNSPRLWSGINQWESGVRLIWAQEPASAKNLSQRRRELSGGRASLSMRRLYMRTCRMYCSGGVVSARHAASTSITPAVARKYLHTCHYSDPLRAEDLHTALASTETTVDGEK